MLHPSILVAWMLEQEVIDQLRQYACVFSQRRHSVDGHEDKKHGE
jgi:hypothetical protein